MSQWSRSNPALLRCAPRVSIGPGLVELNMLKAVQRRRPPYPEIYR
jgi:hypothetical protein